MYRFSRAVRTLVLVGALALIPTVSAAASNIVVTIDAGHGGSESGASQTYNGKTVNEKNLNLTIAKALQSELSTYKGATVYMTRTGDSTLSLDQRVNIAESHNSDLLISVHNNSRGDAQSYTSGSSVLVSSGQYYKDLANCTQSMGKTILSQLNKNPGTTNRGLLKRLSSSSNYPNGARADYYGLIRFGTTQGIPAMIVEHAFLDSSSDYNKFLSSSKALKKLGKADATAIAKYYGLTKKDGSVSYKALGKPVRMISRHWMLKGGRYYYVMNSGKYKTGWHELGKHTYRFASSGAACTGLHSYSRDGKRGIYYFNNRGQMTHGWQKIGGKWYYFRKSTGRAFTNTTRTIDGTPYTFDSKGVCTNR